MLQPVVRRVDVVVLQLVYKLIEYAIVVTASNSPDSGFVTPFYRLPVDVLQIEEGIILVERLPEDLEVLQPLCLRQARLQVGHFLGHWPLGGHEALADVLDNLPVRVGGLRVGVRRDCRLRGRAL
ncbi:MAG: hypothetical protein ABSG67_14915 [Thermoguttaceae bacterium]